MKDPAKTNAALLRHYRLAKALGWAQFAFTMLGVAGAIRKDWLVFAYLPSIAAAVLGSVAMLRAKRLLDEQSADIRPREYPAGCTCVRGALLDNPRCPHHGMLK